MGTSYNLEVTTFSVCAGAQIVYLEDITGVSELWVRIFALLKVPQKKTKKLENQEQPKQLFEQNSTWNILLRTAKKTNTCMFPECRGIERDRFVVRELFRHLLSIPLFSQTEVMYLS